MTGDVEAFLTKNDADGNKVVNTSELEIAVQTRDRLECELRDGIRARHTASRSEEERVARGCEKAKMKSELRPLNFCGASATATVKARRYAPFALRALAAVASSRSFCPFAEWRSFREWGCAGSRVGGQGRFCSSGRGRLDRVVRARGSRGKTHGAGAGGAVLDARLAPPSDADRRRLGILTVPRASSNGASWAPGIPFYGLGQPRAGNFLQLIPASRAVEV